MNIESKPVIDETGALFAGFATAFRYPEGGCSWLSGAEFLEAFDKSASDEAVSLNESAYVNVEASAVFEELVRFYEHFGLRRLEGAELPDHLSVQLEFMHFLCELHHAGARRGEDPQAVVRAQRDFIDRHLRRLLSGMQEAWAAKALPETRASKMLKECREFVEAHRVTLDS
jgi:DMSO reductase family type II enzyme chaperone